jgi:hypothetical protein
MPANFQNTEAWGWDHFLNQYEFCNENCKLFTTSGDLKLRVRFTQYEKSDQHMSGKVDALKCVKRSARNSAQFDFNLLNLDSKMADMEIETLDGKKFKAHKLILAGTILTSNTELSTLWRRYRENFFLQQPEVQC